MLLASWFLVYLFKRYRSFIAKNLESVDQRAAKLQAIKLWEWELSGSSGGNGQAADFSIRPPTLIAYNFEAL